MTRHERKDVQHPIHDTLRHRWSPRAFDPNRAVTPEQLRSLLEAARWAPSSFNEQPWAFLIATRDEPEAFRTMLSCLMEKNQQWAKDAPVLMISVAHKTFTKTGAPNRHAFHDVGQAVANLTHQATAMGLYVHQMAGFDVAKTTQTYHIPADYEPVAAIAMGYLGDPNQLPEDIRAREGPISTRKPQREFVFSGDWGKAAPFL